MATSNHIGIDEMSTVKHIGIDVDGVLRDLATKLVEVFEREHPDLRGLHLPVSSWPEWSGFQNYFPGEVDIRKMTRAHLEEIWTLAPAYPGTHPTLAHLQANHVVHIVTTQFNDWAAQLTCRWLEMQGVRIPEERIHITARKAEVPIDLLVDDMIHNLKAARDAGIIAVCMSRPWNQGWTGVRIACLADLLTIASIDAVAEPTRE